MFATLPRRHPTCGIRVQSVVNNGIVVFADRGAVNPFAVTVPLAPGSTGELHARFNSQVARRSPADPPSTSRLRSPVPTMERSPSLSLSVSLSSRSQKDRPKRPALEGQGCGRRAEGR